LKFGSEAWLLRKREEQRLEAAQMKFLRHLLGIAKLDKEKNQCIRGKNSSRRSGYNTYRGWTQIDYQNKHYNVLIRSNKMQQYAGIYLPQSHSTCFGCPSHPSSGLHKTVTAASGIGHSI